MKTHVVDHVAGIEELGNSEVDVVPRRGPSAVLGLELVGIVEDEVISTVWTVIVQPV